MSTSTFEARKRRSSLVATSCDSTTSSRSSSSSVLKSPAEDPHSPCPSQKLHDYGEDQDLVALSEPLRYSSPPRAKRIPWPLTLHNETLVDNYHWIHEIKQDPEVEDYIKAESEYTASWLRQSGVDVLQEQLDGEMEQIKESIARLPLITEEGVEESMARRRREDRLEGTTFWDLDRWRYWLDDSVGSYGVYKRRFLPRSSSYFGTDEILDQDIIESSSATSSQHILSRPAAKLNSENARLRKGRGCSAESVSLSTVQTVLDVNQLVEKHSHKGQFTMGSVEIQPKSTFWAGVTATSSREDAQMKPKNKGTHVAYTYDVTGDERYSIQILRLPPGKPHDDSRNAGITLDHSPFRGAVVKDAGPATRWAKLGTSLFLYFTRLDPKGLSREVWRVKVADASGEDEEQHEPELVLREDDERLTLSVSKTGDGRYLLIESSGQATSHTYFYSVDSPEQGWNLVRPAEENVKYTVEHHSDFFYLHTNHGDASNFKVLRVPVSSLVPGNSSSDMVSSRAHKGLLDSMDDEVVIDHHPSEYIQRFNVFVRHFVAWIWRDGLQEIRIYSAPRAGDANTTLPLTEAYRIRPYREDVKIATVMPSNLRDINGRLIMNYFSTKLWYSNSSFVHPWAIYEVDMDSLTLPVESRQGESDSNDDDKRSKDATSLVCQDPFPLDVVYGRLPHRQSSAGPTHVDLPMSGIETIKDHRTKQEKAIAKFKEERIMVPSRQSGVYIPVSLVYYAYPDGPQFPRRAAFVKAYGAYGTMTMPNYEPDMILPLLHRGLIFILINPRGDGNLGPEWYANGKAEHKLNTFYDVEDVLVYLHDSGIVAKEGVVMEGRSAGGLVSGWIANRWGEKAEPSQLLPYSRIPHSKNIVRKMVRAVLTQVPFMDVISGMANPDIPWVEYEWAEWGSPLQSKEVFEVMKAYSPYDNIRNQRYPAMMLSGGLVDSRVSFAEPLKFVAKLRGIDGKTNDCQLVHDEVDEDGNRGTSRKVCTGKKDTPLILQMEDGGHFSGKKSLWMAFGLYHLDAADVVSSKGN
ncbi:hypothetical protein BGX31_002713 [Mortierella sp. GBA43]|nr:hypothetical protein BGX31_002713 [Mortierella sp. GBA43]